MLFKGNQKVFPTITVQQSVAVSSLNITPTTSAQTFNATANIDCYAPVTIAGVNSSIDPNIVAGNIKNGVTILGVTGTY